MSHITFPATAIDVTTGTTLDIGRGAGGEAIGIVIFTFGITIVATHMEDVVDGTCRTGSIDILLHRTTEQGNIGVAIDITAAFLVGRSITATVGIVHHLSAFVDDDIGAIDVLAFLLFCVREGREISVIDISMIDQRGVSETSKGFEIVIKLGIRLVVVAQFPSILPVFNPFFLDGLRVALV